MPEDTKEQRKAYIASLLEERRGVEANLSRAKADEDADALEKAEQRLKGIESELKRVGHEAKAPSKSAEKRPASGDKEER